ncbi:MAG: hypothetical protein IKC54_02080 [Clostridia bacterium]|nr:hypothetical protein [Clostridia bacterium]
MKITFVCVGNTCRSPMLKALFEDYAKAHSFHCQVESAGLSVTDGRISHFTENMLLECGICVQNQNTTTLDKALVDSSDLIVAVDKFVAERVVIFGGENKVYSLSSPLLLGRDIMDPYGQGQEAYRAVFEEAKRALPKILALAKMLG